MRHQHVRGTYVYPLYGHRGAEQASLADFPPVRPSGPEPGAYDMPPEWGPMGALPTSTSSWLIIGAVGLGALLFFRKKKRR